MCLYPRLIYNRKYKANKKNGGNIPELDDERKLKVPIKCGRCMECRKAIAREWQIRILEDIKQHKDGKFITLTFSNESINKLNGAVEEIEAKVDARGSKGERIRSEGYERDNRIATIAVRYFLERWRKKYKKSVRHWLITEIGKNGTENIHLHGIIWTDDLVEVEKIWQYGYVWKGKESMNAMTGKKEIINYVSERTANYITKYITKADEKHPGYKGKILCSKGIGGSYTSRMDAGNNRFKEGGGTREFYRTRTGHKIALPVYWRNKIYTEKEREALWIEKLDKEERWVNGMKISIKGGDEREYYKALAEAQALNRELKYGGGNEGWKKAQYEIERRNMRRLQRIKGIKEISIEHPSTDRRQQREVSAV